MSWYETFDKAQARSLPGLRVLKEEPMSRHTTFRIGGPARRLALPETEEELTTLLNLVREFPYTVIGNGSNLLAPDEGVDLLVISTAAMDRVEQTGERTIRALAGASLAGIAVRARALGLAGFAFAHGIPGTLGGAVVMNAGAYGGEMCQAVRRVGAWTPDRGAIILETEELKFGYRRSVFSGWPEAVVLWAELELTPGDREVIRAEMEDLGRRRRSKQPLEYPSAGSTFKRPEGYFAGTLIDQCGLKGYRIGGAQVSEKHAGFIINAGGATCADVLALIHYVQKTVYEAAGVTLEPEVRLLKTERAGV